MKLYREYSRPCVVCPRYEPIRPVDRHVIHGTVGRAQRNAAMTGRAFGFYYHDHRFIRRTLWGLLSGAPKKTNYEGVEVLK